MCKFVPVGGQFRNRAAGGAVRVGAAPQNAEIKKIMMRPRGSGQTGRPGTKDQDRNPDSGLVSCPRFQVNKRGTWRFVQRP